MLLKKITNYIKNDFENEHAHISLYKDNSDRSFYISKLFKRSKYTVSYAHKHGVRLYCKEFLTLKEAKDYLFKNYLDLIIGSDRIRIAKLSSIEQKENFIKKFNL
jgi:hypothetical protein